MSIKIEGHCRVICDGRLENGRPCNQEFTIGTYKNREDVVAQAMTVGGFVQNDRTGKHYCRKCSERAQQQ